MTWKYKDDNMQIEMTLTGSINILTGDSGTGKSYIVKKLQTQLKEKALWQFTKSTIPMSKISICTSADDLDRIYKLQGQFIIFDRFDLYANEQLIEFINTQKNVVLLISRKGYKNIRIIRQQLLVLNSSVKDGICYFKTRTAF